MIKKTVIVVFLIAALLGCFSLYLHLVIPQKAKFKTPVLPVATQGEIQKPQKISVPSIFEQKDIINILLIGSDTSLERRKNGQYGYNTDATILVSINTNSKKVLLTSVPRDLWVGEGKINSLFVSRGWEGLKNAYETVTGVMIDGYVLTDFDGFEWLVNQIGGIDVEIKNSFTDYSFPDRQDSGVVTVSFEQGIEKMSGERALTYARSRKGTNGEGSDIMRAKRQHLILLGIADSFENPANVFWPMDLTSFFDTVTKHMQTDLTLADVTYLWDFYAYRNEYAVESFVVDDAFLYHPGLYPESPYTAWVFIPRDPTYREIHNAVKGKLEGTTIAHNPETFTE